MKANLHLTTILLLFFSSLLTAQNHPNCGFDPVHEKFMENDEDYKKWVEGYKRALSDISTSGNSRMATIRVPVVVHVIHSGEPIGTGQNISDAQIEAQMEILNADFSATNAGYASAPPRWADDIDNPNMLFCLASVDPDGNPTNGITRNEFTVTEDSEGDTNIETEIKPAIAWDPNLYYNIYVLPIPGTTSGGGTTGYAYLPYNGTIGNSSTDGSVVDYRWFGGPGFGNSGSGTLTHETGHYLGLFHPFNGESCTDDDGIADTPNVDAPTTDYTGFINCSNGWPTGPMSCGNEHMYIQYMDYTSPDECSIAFTAGQVAVMRSVLEGTSSQWGSRKPLADNTLAVCSFFDYEVAMQEIISPSDVTCYPDPIVPEVTFTNLGLETLTNLTITYQINAGTPVVFNWVDNLVNGASTTVALPAFTPPAVDYTFEVWTSNPNGFPDEFTANDTLDVLVDRIVPGPMPFIENFEGGDWNPTVNGLTAVNLGMDNYEWVFPASQGAYGASTQSTMFDNYNAPGSQGQLDALFTPILEVTDINELSLSFDYAYTYYDNTFKDSLAVLASVDCGDNYNIVLWAAGGENLATKPAQQFEFVPQADHWVTIDLDVSLLGSNPPNLSLAFVNVNGYGNNIYIDNINMLEGCALLGSPLVTDAVCVGDCNGEVSINVSGETGDVVYAYNNGIGIAGPTVSGLCAGNYEVTISDDAGCSQVIPFTVEDPTPITITPTVTGVSAIGASDGVISLMIEGGTPNYLIDWPGSLPDGPTQLSILSAGIYSINVYDFYGCIETIEVEVPDFDCSSLMHETTGSPLLCFGDSDASIDVMVSGGMEDYSIAWSPGTVSGFSPDNLGVGIYEYTITDASGCTIEDNYEIIEPEELMLSFTSTNLSAPGANDGSATAMVNGTDIIYDWGAQGTGPTITNLEPGVYTVTASDVNLCEVIGSVEIFDVDCTAFSAVLSVMDLSCHDSENGIATVIAAGAEPITYEWSASTDNASMLTMLSPGNISVTVTDDNGCSQILSDEILAPSELMLSLNFDSGISCFGGSEGALSANVSGGSAPILSYNWLNGETTPAQTGLAAGYYCLTITDSNGCETAAEFTMTEPDEIVVSETIMHETSFGANDGSIDLIGNGGTGMLNYDWDNFMTGPNISNLAPGEYSVVVIDENNCAHMETYTILPAGVDCSNFTASMNLTAPTCANGNNGVAVVSASGGVEDYMYVWSVTATGNTANGLGAGAISVTITDVQGCEIILTDIVDAPPMLSGVASSTSTSSLGMSDGSVTAQGMGGTGAYIYNWDIPATGQTINNLPAGIYVVTIIDGNLCEFVTETEILEGDPDCSGFSASMTVEDVLCFGAMNGNAIANVSGGTEPITYDWSNESEASFASGLSPGIVEVTILDGLGCEIILEGEIGEPMLLTASASSTQTSGMGMSDGSVTAQGMGGTGAYIYNWDIPATGQTINNLPAGNYVVTVIDENQCEAVAEVEVTDFNPDCTSLAFQVMISGASCADGSDGTAEVNIFGGMEPYEIEWSVPQMGNPITGLSPGPLSITVTDAFGCELSSNLEVLSPPALGATTSATPTSGPGQNDGSLQAMGTGGGSMYSYAWSVPATGAIVNNVPAGIYTLTVTDFNDCEYITTVEVPEGNPDCSGFSAELLTQPATCAFPGAGVVITIGGQSLFNYNWSQTGVGNVGASNALLPGPVSVTVTDALGCEFIAEGEIDGTVDIFINNETVINTSTPGANDGAIILMASGGSGNLYFDWNGGLTGSQITNLSPGTYTVTITDDSDCELIQSFEVEEGMPCVLNLDVVTEPASCEEANDATATVTPLDGDGQYSFQWSDGLGNSPTITAGIGTYTVTVTDGSSCQGVISVTLEEPLPISVILQGFDGGCGSMASASATANGGTGTYSYLWNTMETTESISGLEAGTYNVTVTDSNGCIGFSSVTVANANTTFEVGYDLVHSSCSGAADGSIVLEVLQGESPYDVYWSNGVTSLSNTGLVPGFYSVLISDANGCNYFSQFEVQTPNPIIIDAFVQAPSSGTNDGVITTNVSGGVPPYDFQWSVGGTDSSLEGVGLGEYTLIVTDANGCSSTETVLIDFTDVAELQDFPEWKVYPNPTSGTAFIAIEGNLGQYQLMVYDLLGNQLVGRAIQSNMEQIELGSFAAGVYLVILENEEGKRSWQRLVKADY